MNNVRRIPIGGFGGGNETPIVWICKPDKEWLRKSEYSERRVKFQFGATTPRSFYNRVYAGLVSPGGQFGKVCHSF